MLQVTDLTLSRGDFRLGPLSLTVPDRSYFVILGRTGSGKTMLLESIVGLQRVASGHVTFDGEDVTELAPEKRDFGFVYQDFALFPNKNVRDNILFASRIRPIDGLEALFEDVVDFLKIEGLLGRRITHLSGGEKQRVAIARAICSRPRLLLLDEPLSAVDPTFRTAIMIALRQIVTRYGISIIHVTHNFREATFLADRIAVMMEGKILQSGDAETVLHQPNSLAVAKFLGFKNILPARLIGHPDPDRLFSVNPNNILFSRHRQDREHCMMCTIEEIVIQADYIKVIARVEGHSIFAKLAKTMFDKLDLKEGERLYACIAGKDAVMLPAEVTWSEGVR